MSRSILIPPPDKPLRIAVIGAGHHSRTYHLPALASYHRSHPGVLALTAIVDPNVVTARQAAAEFGFSATHADVTAMLARENPDACLALTPVALNADITLRLVRLGLPTLMEKPLGATIDEARCLVASIRGSNPRVMVSMNRRFDPLLKDARDWIGPRPVLAIRAVMARNARTEPGFVEHTGLHLVDVVRMIGGETTSCSAWRRPVAGADQFEAKLTFASGAIATIELMPVSGGTGESLEITGADYRVEILSREFDRGAWRAWMGRELVVSESIPPATPLFVANGTFAETEAFVQAVRGERAFSPTPLEVLPSMELCHTIIQTPSLILGTNS